MKYYLIKLSDNEEGIVIPSSSLKNLFKSLQNFMSEGCYYEDGILSIEEIQRWIKKTRFLNGMKNY